MVTHPQCARDGISSTQGGDDQRVDGGLPVVAEGGPYLEILTPSEEAKTYTISKHGALQVVTFEPSATTTWAW